MIAESMQNWQGLYCFNTWMISELSYTVALSAGRSKLIPSCFFWKIGVHGIPQTEFLRGKMTIDFGYPFSDQPRTELIKVDKWCVNHTPHSQGPNMGYMGGRPTQIQKPSEHSTWQICSTAMWMDDINGCHVVSPIIIAHVFDCLHTLHPTHFC